MVPAVPESSRRPGALVVAENLTISGRGVPIPTVGFRSLVPVAVPRAIVALVGFERTTVKVSFCSDLVSPMTGTLIVPVVTSSRTRMLVMRKPEMTKKTSTPT